MSTDDTLPWTTSRCNRLLRPLSSKLAKLRKELERPRPTNTESRNVSSAFATKGSPQKTTNFTRPAHKPRGFEKARDPDWRPGMKPGAAKKTTYGARGRGRPALRRGSPDTTSNVSRPGEIAFTPLISRMGGQLNSSPQMPISPLRKLPKNRGPLLVHLALPAADVPRDVHKLVQGTLEAYANLLQATSTGNESTRKGTRSLMGACLRKLPAYIELEEHFAKLDRLEDEVDEEGRDIANEIYEQLETHFEQAPGLGWRHFRQVVRTHATTLICDAIADEILSLKDALMLITHCLNAYAWEEAEQLLLAYAPLLDPITMPINTRADLFDVQRSPFLHAVKAFVYRTGRHRLLYDVLEHMVALELLPLEWLATDSMRPVWDRLVRSVSENDARTLPSVCRFFETVAFASMGLPDYRLLEDEVTGSVSRRFVPSSRLELRQALDTTFSSLLTVLCSITLVNNSRNDDVGQMTAKRVTRVLDAVVVAIATRQDIKDELDLLGADANDVQVMAQRGIWITFASCLLHLESCLSDPTVVSLDTVGSIGIINWIASQYSSRDINFASIFGPLPSLVSSTARGTGRIWQDDGFDQLQRFVTALMSVSGCRLPHKLWTLKRIALESALEFAHGTGDAEHMAFAREVEKKMQTQGRLIIMQSPAKNASPATGGGFRWEEGIGEWVTCTPFVKHNPKPQIGKPVRALELLPTPVQSEEEKEDVSEVEDDLPSSIPATPAWEATTFDCADEDDAGPQSSPIKKRQRTSTSLLGKRARAPSPKVVIPVKRTQMTPPDTPPVRFYANLPEEKGSSSRRSCRFRQQTNTLPSQSRPKRSRTSLESGLRDVKIPTYAEPALDLDLDLSGSASDTDASSTSQQDSETEVEQPNTRSSSQTRRRSTRHIEANTSPGRDELGKTPARPQSRTSLQAKNQGKPLPHASRSSSRRTSSRTRPVLQKSYHDDSEDELSFY
ncbi:hypothetical protein COCMIDRAFT_2353 [Bipolaris oryzae ATCC 44560]|uniref:Uncharacterized protein n=1 Tax=Bipolaris oryzae ATCC 44560 TaxID=930090 RepID=W6ZYV5_COCMI|nr:uncharacterized protein COCMIDRAFT_2353 [Bipolaris oryzae ATCC 44560]EUC48901.1 hypothetical protein COCMIDRAFT_2353 [Bipolaris oryzae ATCC 44560]